VPRACDRDRPTDVAAARVHPTPPARRAARGSPRVYAGEVHVDPTSRRARSQKPPRSRGGGSRSPYVPAARAGWKPPHSRGGGSRSPYVTPRALAEAPAFTRGSLTFTLRRPARARRSPRVYAGESHLHPTCPARRSQKPPRLRVGVSRSPYVAPRRARPGTLYMVRDSPSHYAFEITLRAVGDA
jgi:hypothetical protein